MHRQGSGESHVLKVIVAGRPTFLDRFMEGLWVISTVLECMYQRLVLVVEHNQKHEGDEKR